MLTAKNPDWQDVLARDPEHGQWLDNAIAQDLIDFDAWLETPDGQRWLDNEAETDEEANLTSEWEGW